MRGHFLFGCMTNIMNDEIQKDNKLVQVNNEAWKDQLDDNLQVNLMNEDIHQENQPMEEDQLLKVNPPAECPQDKLPQGNALLSDNLLSLCLGHRPMYIVCTIVVLSGTHILLLLHVIYASSDD